ncbi:phosphoenolpyruvate hydrolase family protein [Brucella gallinifaecis]|nr:phosphoenolpyruvate hydrolase family protein [Brucella gallinifaecis]
MKPHHVKLLTSVSSALIAPYDVIICPGLAGLPRQALEVAALLPISAMNEPTLAFLKSDAQLTHNGFQEKQDVSAVTLALMMADPFLRPQAIFDLLRRKRIKRVTNYPTIQLHDGDSARAFKSASIGLNREIEMMTAFCQAGFAGTAFVTSLDAARLMLQAGADTLVLHPGLFLLDWRSRATAAKRINQTLLHLRADENAKAKILVMKPDGYGAELDTICQMADGTVTFEL